MLVSDFIMKMQKLACFGVPLVCIAKVANTKEEIQIILMFIVDFVLT